MADVLTEKELDALRAKFAHTHTANCYRKVYTGDCGEHHAHDYSCTHRRELSMITCPQAYSVITVTISAARFFATIEALRAHSIEVEKERDESKETATQYLNRIRRGNEIAQRNEAALEAERDALQTELNKAREKLAIHERDASTITADGRYIVQVPEWRQKLEDERDALVEIVHVLRKALERSSDDYGHCPHTGISQCQTCAKSAAALSLDLPTAVRLAEAKAKVVEAARAVDEGDHDLGHWPHPEPSCSRCRAESRLEAALRDLDTKEKGNAQ